GAVVSSVETPAGSSPGASEVLDVGDELLPGGEHAARVRASAAPPAMSTAELRRFLMRTASPSKGYTLLSTHRRRQLAGRRTATWRNPPPLPAMKSAVRRRIGSSQYRFDGELPISRRELLRHLAGPRGLEQAARDLVELGADVVVGLELVADARGDPHEREGQLACVAALDVPRGAPVVDGRGTTRPRAEDGAHLLDRHVEHRTRLDRGLGEAARGGPHEVVDLLGAQRARG